MPTPCHCNSFFRIRIREFACKLVSTHRELFIFNEIPVAVRSRPGFEVEQKSEAERISDGAEPFGTAGVVGLFRDYRENIADKTARRYCSREISVDNSTEAQLRNFPRLTIDCYRSKISFSFCLFFLARPRFPLRSRIAFAEINLRSHRWQLLARHGSAPVDFSSSTIADTIDMEKRRERAAVVRRTRFPRGEGARRRRPRTDATNENGLLSTGGLRLFQE